MLGCLLAVHGWAYISRSQAEPNTWALALLAMGCAASLILGIFTPIASLLTAVGVVGVALSWIAAPAKNLFAEGLMAVNAVVTSFSILLLGPGAFSLDARLFGRREIIIPHTSSSIQR